jgi:hypothetical protein
VEARRRRGRGRPWDAAASGPRSRAAVGARRRGEACAAACAAACGGAAACAGAAADDAGGVGAGLRRPAAWRGRGCGGRRRGGRGAAAGGVERRASAAWRQQRSEKKKLPGAIYTFFAECPRSGTRQRFFKNIKIFFAECQIAGTRQSGLCQVPDRRHSTKNILPSASWMTLVKESFTILCRVLYSWHSANIVFAECPM